MAEDLMEAAAARIEASRAAQDPDRPLVHLAPPVGRLNDPNGLLLHEGRFHAFYQFSPLHPRKLVYWGHASTSDLLHWSDHGPALAPDRWYDSHGVYSGSAVHTGEEIALFYTGNVRDEQGGRSAHQCMATTSNLTDFRKHPKNPVVDPLPDGYTAHVRDPQVWRTSEGIYRMLLGAQRSDETGCALLLSSPDLLTWRFDGELGFPDADGRFDQFGYMWECPNLVRVPDETTGELHDVFIFCPQGIAAPGEGFQNVFACGYLVGRLEGTQLRRTGDFHELDRGFEFYAPQVVARDEPGPATLLAWVGNAGEDQQPSLEHEWVHLLSCARDLALRDGRLVQRPHLPFEAGTELAPQVVGGDPHPLAPLEGSRSFLLDLELDTSAATGWSLVIGSPSSQVRLDFHGCQLTVDRSATRYPHGDRRVVSLPSTPRPRLRLAHDRSVTELFLDDGALSFTMRSYLDPEAGGVTLQADGQLQLLGGRANRLD
ncbi:glycoside hydrolase family 32 protein [Luteococcus sp. OSA5]|uniref:glycoside hydrolase family 32 protein n=1 Tax=Luteococcus sp. OSA5 TaxID=3401630 RepID=UPI003B439276